MRLQPIAWKYVYPGVQTITPRPKSSTISYKKLDMCGASTFFSTCVIAPLADVNALLLLSVPIPLSDTQNISILCHGKRSSIVAHVFLQKGLVTERDDKRHSFSVAHTIQNVLKIDHELIEPQWAAHSYKKLRRDSAYVSCFQKDSRPHLFVVPNGKFHRSMLQGLSSGLCNPHRTYY